MFKKPLKVSNHNLLGGKDRKTLKKDLSALFQAKSIEHFFDSNEKIYCDKMQGSKVVVYSTETFPAFVDSTGKGAYFPTLYLAQAYPKMLEPIHINPGVSNFIFNGANLMWPGVRSPETTSEFKADDVRVIIADSNKPIAIGAMGCDFAELKTNNLQGVAVYVLHVLDDKLWEMGPKTTMEVIFSGEEKKVEIPAEEKKVEKAEEKKVEDEEDDQEEDEDELANFAALVKKGKHNEENLDEPTSKQPTGKKEKSKAQEYAAPPVKKSEKEAPKKEMFSDEDDDKKKKGKKKGGKGGKPKEEETKEKDKKETKGKEKDPKKKEKEVKKDKKPKKEEDEEEGAEEEEEDKREEADEEDEEKEGKGTSEPAIPIKIMDEYIYEAFMNAIRMSVTEKDLPLDSSAFYANHMLMCKKENIMIDLKNSSYKKIGKFFQTMAKLNLIEYKEAKKGMSPQITKINRSHEKYEKWEPTIGKVGSKKVEEEKKGNEEKWPKVLVEDLYKPKDSMKQIFAVDKEKKVDNLYTMEEVKNVLNEYIKNNCKIEKKLVKMDPLLCSLYCSKIEAEVEVPQVEVKDPEKHEEEEGGEVGEGEAKKVKKVRQPKSTDQIPKEELFQRFEDDMLKWHRITNVETKKSETRAGNFKGITITAEKAHNKNITKMVGLEQFGMDLNELSSRFQLKFACSVSTHELPGKNAGKEFVVHGNFLQDIMDYFTNECKVDRKYIISHNKLEKKKK